MERPGGDRGRPADRPPRRRVADARDARHDAVVRRVAVGAPVPRRPPHLHRAPQRPSDAGPVHDLPAAVRDRRHRPLGPVPGRRDRRAPARRGAALRVRGAPRRRGRRLPRGRVDPAPRARLAEHHLAAPDRLADQHRVRPRRPAGARPARSQGRHRRVRAARDLHLLFRSRRRDRRRADRRGAARPRVALRMDRRRAARALRRLVPRVPGHRIRPSRADARARLRGRLRGGHVERARRAGGPDDRR